MRNTLTYKKCGVCGRDFARGRNGALDSKYCSRCEEKGWLIEMKKMGCSVGDSENLGVVPHMVRVNKSSLPKVKLDGETYTDVTQLLFADGKYEKKYLTQKERDALDLADYKKRKYRHRKR